MQAAELGQASDLVLGPNGERFSLVSYLESPVPEQTKLDYVLFGLPPAGSLEKLWLDYVKVDSYFWTVDSSTDALFTPVLTVTDTGCFSWEGQRPGHEYTIQVTPRFNNADLATIELTQGVRAREPKLEEKLKRKRKDPGEPDCQRELINDFGDYIRSFATALGPKGVSARVLAAILYMEINARPKDETGRARMYRARTRINRTPTWAEWTESEVRQWMNSKQSQVRFSNDFFPLTEIRCIELSLFGDVYDDAIFGDRLRVFGGKSLGVGQIALSTAAMVLGITPWIDGTPGKLDRARTEIDQNWKAVTMFDKVGIFNLLRFPKTNIKMAADLLARLKNRPNRNPDLLAVDLWKDELAVSLLATEYNQGATDSALADAKLPTNSDANWRRATRFVKPSYPVYPELFFP